MTKSTGKRTRKVTVHTIESLLARTVEVGECKNWTGYVGNNTPQVFCNGKITTVRRVLLALSGKELNQDQYAVPTCGNPLCVEPSHIKIRTMSQQAKVMASKVNFNGLVRVKKLSDIARAHRSKITAEQAREIRMSAAPTKEVVAQYGISKNLVCRIRRGDTWKEYGGMWAGLGGR